MENEDVQNNESNNSSQERIEHTPKNEGKLTGQLRNNPWIASTFVLGIVVLIFITASFGAFTGKTITGGVIGTDDAGSMILQFVHDQTGGEGDLVNVTDYNNYFYEVVIDYQNQDIPLYITKDGEYLVQGLAPLSELIGSDDSEASSSSTEVPKSDNPEVELFIWSYCPYGVQAQGPLAEVASLLGNYANFKGVMYYDGHGEYETQENKIQECIQQVAPEKYWEYATGFVEDIYPECSVSRNVGCDKTKATTLMNSLGIDSGAVFECVDSQGEDLISDASSRAKEVGVTGSPSLVINGVKVSTARTAEAYKTAICDAFTEGNAPSECGEVLSSTAGTASGSC